MFMPLPGSCAAPKTFDGNEDDITDFLEHFLLCAARANLPQEARMTWFFRYLSKKQRPIFRVFKGYKTNDWVSFERTIKEEYRHAFKEKPYTQSTLMVFIRKTKENVIVTDRQLREYYREFQSIARILIEKGDMTEEGCVEYFWLGLHGHTKSKLASRLVIQYPNHPRNWPYPIKNVMMAGEIVFDQELQVWFGDHPPLVLR